MCFDLSGISISVHRWSEESLKSGGLGVRPDYNHLLLNKRGSVNLNAVQALQSRFTLPQPNSQVLRINAILIRKYKYVYTMNKIE